MAIYFVACQVKIKDSEDVYTWNDIIDFGQPIVFSQDLVSLRNAVFGKVRMSEEREVGKIRLTALSLLDTTGLLDQHEKNMQYVYWACGIGDKDPDNPDISTEGWDDHLILDYPILSDDDLEEAEQVVCEMRGYEKVLISNMEFLIILRETTGTP
ncbi:hypothetical protein CL630_00555 [bacterium]|nr:hypothetical protein [bacterium]|tara:strand:+ start:2208 stop:2672 length:465 start_codon:yes stop_codon:yes gene_type:complete